MCCCYDWGMPSLIRQYEEPVTAQVRGRDGGSGLGASEGLGCRAGPLSMQREQVTSYICW
jgi:hypothetical protein